MYTNTVKRASDYTEYTLRLNGQVIGKIRKQWGGYIAIKGDSVSFLNRSMLVSSLAEAFKTLINK